MKLTFREKLRIFFYRSKCFLIVLTHPDKRVTTHVVYKIKENAIEYNGNRYIIDSDKVIHDLSTGLPTSFYHVSNPNPAHPTTWTPENFNSETLSLMMNSKIVADLTKEVRNRDNKSNTTNILYAVIALGVIMIIGFYYMYSLLQVISEENSLLREFINEQVARGIFD